MELQQKIMNAVHASALGGHSGFPVTYKRLKALFAWPSMKAIVHQFVDRCSVCKKAKPERIKYPRLLLPLPIPDKAWKIVSLDFIDGLPKSNHFNCILVVVDKFSKYTHFIPLTHPFSALTVAQRYMISYINCMGCHMG